MQLSVPWRRGQVRPFGSIPRINWAHPLASGLVTYMYDAGGGVVIDLCGGKCALQTKIGTPVNPPFPSPNAYGVNSWNTNGGQAGGGSGAWGIYIPTAQVDGVVNAAPYSVVIGLIRYGANFSGQYGTLFAYADTSTNTPFWFALDPSQQPVYGLGGGSLRTFAVSPPIKRLATLGAVMTASTSATGYYIDPTNGLTTQTNTEGLITNTGLYPVMYNEAAPGSIGADNGFNGSILYGAVWKSRALTATDIIQINADPWCLLWYPEDEIFATMVGATAQGFTWSQTGDDQFFLPKQHTVREMIRHD